jgi:hypothetical protein
MTKPFCFCSYVPKLGRLSLLQVQDPHDSAGEMEGTCWAAVHRDASKSGRLSQIASNSPSKANVLSVSLSQSTKRWLDKRMALSGGHQHEHQADDDKLNVCMLCYVHTPYSHFT